MGTLTWVVVTTHVGVCVAKWSCSSDGGGCGHSVIIHAGCADVSLSLGCVAGSLSLCMGPGMCCLRLGGGVAALSSHCVWGLWVTSSVVVACLAALSRSL